MKHVNKIRLIGRVVNTPEIKVLDNIRFISFKIAVVTKNFCKKTGVETVENDFIDVKCYGKIATFTHSVVKRGDSILLNGSIRKTIDIDADGYPCDTTWVVANNIKTLGALKKRDERVIYWNHDHNYYICHNEKEARQFEQDVKDGNREPWSFKIEMYKEKRDDINQVLKDPYHLGF